MAAGERGDDGLTRREALAAGAAGAAGIALAGALPAGAAQAAVGAARRPAYALGFESMTREVRLPRLPVDGRVPRWLSGALLRNGPSKFEVGSERFNHWFDGLAMLHAFSFSRGRVSYANRFLRSSAYEAWKTEGRIRYSEFGTDPCRAIFSGVASIPIIAPVPNANVSLERWAGTFRAHTEIPVPVRFDARTLATLGTDPGAASQMGTAHPHQDPATGERFSYETLLLGERSGVAVFAEKAGGPRRELAFLRQARPRYMHSFALTRRYVVLFTQPFEVDPGSFLQTPAKPIVEHFSWNARESSRVVVIDRGGRGVVAEVEVDPFFVFHHINAFERGDVLELDVSGHRDATIVDALYLKNLRSADQRMPPVSVRRISVDLRTRRARVRPLSDTSVELPRIDYERRNARSYRYVYGIGQRGRRSGFVDQLVKLDVRSGRARIWRDRGCYPGEPVFVARPGSRREDDGVVLSVVLDARRRTSFLLVLEAGSFQERARAAVPHHIPFGFHGIHAKA
jgi:carotenoid cleavage dioxygenase-like enzyme